jgi:hypothetical protein
VRNSAQEIECCDTHPLSASPDESPMKRAGTSLLCVRVLSFVNTMSSFIRHIGET